MEVESLGNSPLKAMLTSGFRRTFGLWQRIGIHITPNHYYWPVPDTRHLSDELWSRPSQLAGVDMGEDGQLQLLRLFASQFKTEYDGFPNGQTDVPYRYRVDNPKFGTVDGEILYCMIRHFKPKRVFEIGSGNSTYCSAQAVERNRKEDPGYTCDLVAFEPYPNEVLKAGFPGLSRLVPVKCQDIPLGQFEELGENDILFIDSSHVLRIGNDVQREFLEILPRLRSGVIAHVHNIYLPAEYPKEFVLENYLFWTEQYLLQAFLTYNSAFEVLWGANFMHLNHADELEAAFSSYRRDIEWPPSSFWMRRTR